MDFNNAFDFFLTAILADFLMISLKTLDHLPRLAKLPVCTKKLGDGKHVNMRFFFRAKTVDRASAPRTNAIIKAIIGQALVRQLHYLLFAAFAETIAFLHFPKGTSGYVPPHISHHYRIS